MALVKNAMEIFSILDKSNCRKCGEKTCLAFAGAVFLGKRRIEACPQVSKADIDRFSNESVSRKGAEEEQDQYIAFLTDAVVQLDYEEAARRTGALLEGGVLNVRVLGKKFGIGRDGSFSTNLHVIPWLVIPLLDYVKNCKGVPVSGDWISFRELTGGKEKYALFKKRGEDVLRDLADKYTDFFDDVIHMFEGKAVDKQFESDVSVVLFPFPLVPIMLCYWKPEDGLGSSLNLFFDKHVEKNLGADALFFLGTGLAQMFEKLADHHGF
jgi:hypothetical protein